MKKASLITVFLLVFSITTIAAAVLAADAQAEMSRDLNFHYGENLIETRALVNDLEASAIADLNDLPATLEIDPTSGPRGTTVTVSGEGWPVDNFVTISYELLDTPGKTDVAIV